MRWEEARGRLVSGGFFQVLGVGPAIGRVFTAADDRADDAARRHQPRYWQRRFGGRSDVLGKTLTVRNATVTIIGVAPPRLHRRDQRPAAGLLAAAAHAAARAARQRSAARHASRQGDVAARVRTAEAGVTPAQAEAQANAIFQASLESFYGAAASAHAGASFCDQRLQLQPAARGASSTRREFSQSLTALLAAVGVLLLIACANLANLLLARGAARKPEIALRVSLGASRGRLIRQLVTESLALAAVGGIAAIAVAFALHGALVRMLAESDSRFELSFALDPLVLAFVAGATVARRCSSACFRPGRSTRTERSAPQRTQPRRHRHRCGRCARDGSLVGLQLALSLPLLVGAGSAGADRLQPAARRPRVSRRTPAARPRRSARGGLSSGARARQPAPRAARTDAGDSRRAGDELFAAGRVHAAGVFGQRSRSKGYTPKGETDRESAVDVVGPGYFSTLGVPHHAWDATSSRAIAAMARRSASSTRRSPNGSSTGGIPSACA